MVKKVKADSKKLDKEPTATEYKNTVYNTVLDQVERDVGVSSEEMATTRLSTGILSLDMIIGGGMRNGMMTQAGQEGSAKTTSLITILAHAVKSGVPIVELGDSENALDPLFTRNIAKVKSLDEIFGKKVDGKWVIEPKIRYYDDNIIETTFDRIARTLNRIPDKIYNSALDKWFLVVDPTDKKMANFNVKTLGDPNSKLSTKTRLWFPTDNPHPQAVIGIDSYPALLAEGIDENEESSKAMAQQARAYSQQLPRVVGKLRRKHVLLIGVNQIRENPGARFMDPRYEPGGNSLKFSSSVRNWFTPRGVPDEWKNKDSKLSEEPSVEGRGVDKYAYKHIGNKKCKWGTPFLESWIRVWVSDCNGEGRGIDPAFDTYVFLEGIGLVNRSKSKGSNMINFIKGNHPYAGKSFEWLDFKTLILAEEYRSKYLREEAAKVCKKYNINKPYLLRKSCFDMITCGDAAKAATDSRNNKGDLKRLKVKAMDDDLED